MNMLEIANERYSVKKFDASFKLSEDELTQVKELLRLSPSSVNSQPWNFTIATSSEGIEKIAKSTKDFGFNDEKIRDASALIVFSVADIDENWMTDVNDKEALDGRYPNEEMRNASEAGKKYFYNLNKETGVLDTWLTSQVYLNAGHFVLALKGLGIDSVIMEGFDKAVLKEELNTKHNPVLIVGIGRGHDEDYNKALKTSRLDEDQTITLI